MYVILNHRKVKPDLTAAEVLQEEGEALDDGEVFGTVSAGVTDEDLGSGPGSVCAQRCGLR